MDFKEKLNQFLLFVYVVVIPVSLMCLMLTLMYLILTGEVSLEGQHHVDIFVINLDIAIASVVLALLIFAWLKDNL